MIGKQYAINFSIRLNSGHFWAHLHHCIPLFYSPFPNFKRHYRLEEGNQLKQHPHCILKHLRDLKRARIKGLRSSLLEEREQGLLSSKGGISSEISPNIPLQRLPPATLSIWNYQQARRYHLFGFMDIYLSPEWKARHSLQSPDQNIDFLRLGRFKLCSPRIRWI